MAIYHLYAGIIQRSKGRSAVAAAAYRAGVQMLDERTGLTHDYSRRSDVVHSEMMLPYCEEVPDHLRDREALWNHIESIESQTTRPKQAQLAREIEFALPKELNREQHIKLSREFISRTFVESGMIADLSIHDKEDGNPHCHVMLSMREMDISGGFHPKKKRDWNKSSLLEKWRKDWEVEANNALEKAGHEARIDCRTLKEQGIDRTPSIHMGVTASSMEKKGKTTERGKRQRKIEKDNIIRLDEVRRLKEEQAAIEKKIDEEHKKNPALWLEETHAKVQANQRLEREAADLGRDAWYWKKQTSRHEWQLEKLEEENKQKQTAFDKGCTDIFKDVEAARAALKASEWQSEPQAAKELEKHLKGFSKWFKTKKYVEADKQKIAAVLKEYQRLKLAQVKISTVQEKANQASVEALKTERLFKSQRAALGSSRQRANRRAALYGKRSEALRYASEKDIWNSNLPLEVKEDLAREWEKHQQQSQVQAATYGRTTPSWKERGGKVDFRNEMTWSENQPAPQQVEKEPVKAKPVQQAKPMTTKKEKGAAVKFKSHPKGFDEQEYAEWKELYKAHPEEAKQHTLYAKWHALQEEVVESLEEEAAKESPRLESPWRKVEHSGEQVQKPSFSDKVKGTVEMVSTLAKVEKEPARQPSAYEQDLKQQLKDTPRRDLADRRAIKKEIHKEQIMPSIEEEQTERFSKMDEWAQEEVRLKTRIDEKGRWRVDKVPVSETTKEEKSKPSAKEKELEELRKSYLQSQGVDTPLKPKQKERGKDDDLELD